MANAKLTELSSVPLPLGDDALFYVVQDLGTVATSYQITMSDLSSQIGGASSITDLTGDVTASGPGSVPATIANDAITTGKILNNAVTTAKIADSNVTTAKIADANVTLAKIANAATSSKVLGSGSSGSGAPYAEITLGTNLSMSGTTLNASGGVGSVTSVAQSFTGGLISVGGSPITSSGTLALTVAGTSGGIPYFSGAATWASSAALTAHGVVIGGGAGTTPTSTSAGTSGQILTSNGAGADPTFQSIGSTVTGSGTSGQITYWSGTSTIAGDTGLQWDATNNTLGINTTPSTTVQLTVKGDGSNNSGEIVVSNSASTVNGFLNADSADAIIQVGALSNHPLVFYTNSVERARINAAGTFTFPSTGFVMDKIIAVNSTADAFTVFTLKGATGFDDANIAFHSRSDTVQGIVSASQGNSEFTIGSSTNHPIRFYTNSVNCWDMLGSGQLKNKISGNETTGAGTALLGTNSPAVTNTAPFTWWKVTTQDGSQGYIPVWK